MDEVINIYIYEVKKGTKPMALVTVKKSDTEKYVEKIRKNNLAVFVQNIDEKDNIFFGTQNCIKIISGFAAKGLNMLTPEEDFILGIMLGYSRTQQCNRYLNKLNLCPYG